MSLVKFLAFGMAAVIVLSSCDKSEVSPVTSAPIDSVSWALDISLGRGVKNLANDTVMSGSMSGTIVGKIVGYSKEKFADSLLLTSNIDGRSVRCLVSDSGSFSFRGYDLMILQSTSLIRIVPKPKAGFALKPYMITIAFSNY
jgi:hypothetical protein